MFHFDAAKTFARLAPVAAFAACLAGALWLASLPTPQTRGTRFVSVVDTDGALPALVVAVDTLAETVTVRPVGAEVPAGRSLELWFVPSGEAPRSLGLVEPGTTPIRLPAARIGRSPGTGSFAVSVEPPGGSPADGPTGPVIYSGRLIAEDP